MFGFTSLLFLSSFFFVYIKGLPPFTYFFSYLCPFSRRICTFKSEDACIRSRPSGTVPKRHCSQEYP